MLCSLCLTQPYRIYQLMQAMRSQMQATRFVDQKLMHLFHYAILCDLVIGEFLLLEHVAPKVKKESIAGVKQFYVQDIVYTLCNILMDTVNCGKLQQAAAFYLHQFCRKILPKCSGEFCPHLNYVVSALLPMVERGGGGNDDNADEPSAAAQCLRFLIVEQQLTLAAGIAVLDNFPPNKAFDTLRPVHQMIKYAHKEFTLSEELQYFQKVPKRKVEGLIALREQVCVLVAVVRFAFYLFSLSLVKAKCKKVRIGRCLSGTSCGRCHRTWRTKSIAYVDHVFVGCHPGCGRR